MVRCIDHPTMLKDGFGWGTMCSVSAAQMTKADFTGAPALTSETEQWKGLASDWFEPKWDDKASSKQTVSEKNPQDYAMPVLDQFHPQAINHAAFELDRTDTQHLFELFSYPIKGPTVHVS
jgi:hypothetical protein